MSRNELLKTCEDQKKQIEKYEQKLRDIIKAYKGLRAEKEALEASLTALSLSESVSTLHSAVSNATEWNGDQTAKGDVSVSVDEVSGDGTSKSQDTAREDSNGGILMNAESERVLALKKALTTLTQEKSRLESAWLIDKKRLLEEHDDLKNQVANLVDEHSKQRRLIEQQLNEAKASVRQAQAERECEQSDHSAMIKELQQKWAYERANNDHKQKQIVLLQAEIQDAASVPEKYEHQIADLTSELSRLKHQLKEAQGQVKDTADFHTLQAQIVSVKTQYESALDQEHQRAVLAEKQLSHLNEQSEARVLSLENRIDELSRTLGDYERQRQLDMENIEKLKGRVSQLDQENHKLARSVGDVPATDPVSLAEQLKKIAQTLTKQSAHQPVNFYELLELTSPDELNVHAQCRRDYECLKEDFEKFKLRSQAVLKTKAKDSVSKETDYFKNQAAALQNKLDALAQQKTAIEKQHDTIVSDLRQTIAQLREGSERDRLSLQRAWEQKLSDLEAEMAKNRERTLELLTEKDQEIEHLRFAYRNQTPVPVRGSSRSDDGQISPASVGGGRKSSESVFLPIGAAAAESTSIYYVQELARRDKELHLLQQQKTQLENTMREIQHAAVSKDLQNFETIEKLKDLIRDLESNAALHDGDANLEYLRNVLLQYCLCDFASGKNTMLKAVGQVLKFTNKEIEEIKKHNIRWYWWNSNMQVKS